MPRPSARAWADAFLSPAVFPSTMNLSSPQPPARCGCSSIHWHARQVQAVVMFCPAASPVVYRNRRWTALPRTTGSTETSSAWSETWRTTARRSPRCRGAAAAKRAAPSSRENTKTGARVIAWAATRVVTPPARVAARAPRVADETRAPSVVAIGV